MLAWIGLGLLAAASGVAADCVPKRYPADNSTLSPVNLTDPIANIRWAGFDEQSDKYVFAVTEGTGTIVGGHLYRSEDYGVNWANITDKLPGVMDVDEKTRPDYRGVVDIHFQPWKPDKFFFQGAGRHHWVSEDFGQTFKQLNTPADTLGYWSQIKLHPKREDWLLALVRRNECLRESTDLDKWCAADLFFSQDFAKSWQNLTQNSKGRIASFVDFDWGAELEPWGSKPRHTDETIFATAYESAAKLKGPYQGWDKDVHYVISHDFFQTMHEKVASCGNKFDIVAHKVFLALPSNCPQNPDGSKRKVVAEEADASSVIMYVSGDEGVSFTEACIPVGDLDLGYSIMGNYFGDSAFVIVNHNEQNQVSALAPVSNIYSSGGNSSLFSLALPNVYRRGGSADFVAVEGLPGVYLANRLSSRALQEAAFHWDVQSVDYQHYVQTRVSFSGGAHWEALRKPAEYRHASCDTCSKIPKEGHHDACQLHLHGPSSYASGPDSRPKMHTHWASPGVVVAVGNTGEFLDHAADATCTYLSRDGGLNWEDIADHTAAFEIGDQGGILIMARHQTQGPASEISFSMDQGLCWNTIALAEPIDVIGISVEPTAASQVFLVHGQACQVSDRHPNCTHTEAGTPPMGKLYAVDVQDLMKSDWKVCSDDAYEKWSPPEERVCLLGRNLTMSRRKRDAGCFNGKDWQRPEGFHEYCACDLEDTECEFGYTWNWVTRACDPLISVDPSSCAKVRTGEYTVSEKHRRLIAGDVCTNVSRVIPDTDGRGHSTLPPRGWFAWLGEHLLKGLAWLAGLALVAGILVFVVQRFSDGQVGGLAAAGDGLASSVSNIAGNAASWARNNAPGMRGRQQAGDGGYFQPLSDGPGNGFDDLDEADTHSPGHNRL